MRQGSKLKDPSYEARLFKQRLWAAVLFIIILLVILIARLCYLQLDQHQRFTTLSKKNQLNVVPIPPNRGLIYDRNGVLLAENIPVFSLMVTPDKVTDLEKNIAAISAFMDVDDDDLTSFRKQLKQGRRFDNIPLKAKLSQEEVARFYLNRYRFPGFHVDAQLIRHYPNGSVAEAAVGYVGRINEKETNEVDPVNYSATNYIGKTGVEKFYEKQLHGEVGYQQVETDASGRIVRIISRQPPKPGENIYLTLDSNLQRTAIDAFGNNRGALVAISPKSGEVLALVSNPSFDPNLFVTGISHQDYNALSQSPDQPLYNRAIRGLYPIGSPIKPFLALQGLATHTVTPNDRIYDKGYFQIPNVEHHWRDWKKGGHGWVNLGGAITQSCDTYFYDLSLKLGIGNISKILFAFGFGRETEIDIPNEKSGLIPTPSWKRQTKNQGWYAGDTIISAIGQGYMLTTPLQLAQATSILANRGQGFKPHLLLKQQLAGGSMQFVSPQPITPVQLPEPIWQYVIKAMQDVITSPQGTGYRYGRPAYTIAAKTGTAQLFSVAQNATYQVENVPERLRDNSMFIAFAPVDDPKIVVAIVAENTRIAPDITRKVIDYYLVQEHS